MEYYPSITNEEILQFAGIWMDLEGIMLSKTNQTRRTIIKLFNLHVKYIKRIKFIEKKDQTCGYLRQKVREGKMEEYGQKVLTSSYQTDNYLAWNLQDDYIDRS